MKAPNPIRVGIVGLGRAGGLDPSSWKMHCSELQGREGKFRIVAACDVIPQRRAQMVARYGCRPYARIEDLAADPNVDLVDIATRSCDHLPHALIALRAGKHVFLEKPITVDYAQALKLRSAAARAKGRLFIRHNRRFESAFVRIRDIIATGVLGDVFEIKLRRNGFQRRADWQTILSFGGGQLLNWGPHIIDHALRLLESPVADVWGDLKRVAAVGDAEDQVRILLRGKNGRVVDLEISGGAALPEPEYMVLGSRGALTCSGADLRMRYIDPAQKLLRFRARAATPGTAAAAVPSENLQWVEKAERVAPDDLAVIWDHLYEAIRNGKRFPITLEESVEVMRVISEVRKGTPFRARG